MAASEVEILLVDDDEDMCELVSAFLSKEGFRPVCLNDGEAALKRLHKKVPDLLLLDFMMPGINGMDVLKQAKRLNEHLPIIMITGYAHVEGAVEAMRAGASDYIAKPFRHTGLVQMIQRILAERGSKSGLDHLSGPLQEEKSLQETMGPSDGVVSLIHYR